MGPDAGHPPDVHFLSTAQLPLGDYGVEVHASGSVGRLTPVRKATSPIDCASGRRPELHPSWDSPVHALAGSVAHTSNLSCHRCLVRIDS